MLWIGVPVCSGSRLPGLRLPACLRQGPSTPHPDAPVRPAPPAAAAISSSLNAISGPFVREPAPSSHAAAAEPSRTAIRSGSTSADAASAPPIKGKKAGSASRSSTRHAVVFGYFARLLGVSLGRRIPDLAQRPLRPRTSSTFVILWRQPRLRHRLRPHVPHRRPEAQRTVADRTTGTGSPGRAGPAARSPSAPGSLDSRLPAPPPPYVPSALNLAAPWQTPRRAGTGRQWRGKRLGSVRFGDFDRCTTRSWTKYGPGRMQHNFCRGLLAGGYRSYV